MRDWFQAVKICFETLLLPLAGKPLAYLEVGVCRGVSLAWVLKNVLTHDDSRAIGVDIWDSIIVRRRGWTAGKWYADAVAAVSPYADKTTLIKADSHIYLPTLDDLSFDIAYLDGNHLYQGVIQDSREAWRVLKVGGLLGWDDYNIGARRARSGKPAVTEAVDDFLNQIASTSEVVLRHKRQRWVRKLAI
jgi:hypothetical protein